MSQTNPYASPTSNLTGHSSGSSEVSSLTLELLRKTKPWARIVSVALFIGAAFMILAGFMVMLVGAAAFADRPEMREMPGGFGFLGLIYIIFGFLYLYPAYKLFRYCSRISNLLDSNNVSDLEAALAEQMGFWRFVGILTLVMMVLMGGIFALGFLGAIIGAAAS